MKLTPLFTVPRSGSELLCNALRAGGLRYAAELNHPGYRKILAQEFGAELEDMSLQKMISFFAANSVVWLWQTPQEFANVGKTC